MRPLTSERLTDTTSMAASSKLPLRPPQQRRVVSPHLPLLEAVVSGGQTGADQAGLRAACLLGLATGGWAPRGWLTLDGPAPWLGTEYGLIESEWDYAGRTSANVRDSSATVRIAHNFCSTGERCTLKAIKKWGRPYVDVNARFLDPEFEHAARRLLVRFLAEYKIRVLNVAGNSEKTSPGIGRAAEAFLVRALRA